MALSPQSRLVGRRCVANHAGPCEKCPSNVIRPVCLEMPVGRGRPCHLRPTESVPSHARAGLSVDQVSSPAPRPFCNPDAHRTRQEQEAVPNGRPPRRSLPRAVRRAQPPMEHGARLPRNARWGGQHAPAVTSNTSSGSCAESGKWGSLIPRNWEEALALVAARAGPLWAGPVPRLTPVPRVPAPPLPQSLVAAGSGLPQQYVWKLPEGQTMATVSRGSSSQVQTTGIRQAQAAADHLRGEKRRMLDCQGRNRRVAAILHQGKMDIDATGSQPSHLPWSMVNKPGPGNFEEALKPDASASRIPRNALTTAIQRKRRHSPVDINVVANPASGADLQVRGYTPCPDGYTPKKLATDGIRGVEQSANGNARADLFSGDIHATRSLNSAALRRNDRRAYQSAGTTACNSATDRQVSQAFLRTPVHPDWTSRLGWLQTGHQRPTDLPVQQGSQVSRIPTSAATGCLSISITVPPPRKVSKLLLTIGSCHDAATTEEGTVAAGVDSRSRAAALPLPMTYCRERFNGLQFPADVDEDTSRILVSNLEPPIERYQKLRATVFVERKPRKSKGVSICQCAPPKDGGPGCTDNCINRLIYYECLEKHCPCGSQCSNRRFQTGERVESLEVCWTKARGHGLRTLVSIPKGALVIEYLGEVISLQECRRRMETMYAKKRNHYFLGYDQGEVLDAAVKGNEARFANHSCEPNCHIEKWSIQDGEIRVGLFASRDIKAGEEVSYDYNFETFPGATRQQCRCGSAGCRGVIGRRREEPKPGQSMPADKGRPVGIRGAGTKFAAERKRAGGLLSVQKTRGERPTLGERRRQGAQGKWVMKNAGFLHEHRTFLVRNVRAVDKDYVHVRALESGTSVAAAMEQFKQRWTLIPKRKYTRKAGPPNAQPAKEDGAEVSVG